MNGFRLLNKHPPESYVRAAKSSKPYAEQGSICLDVEYKDREFGIVFLSMDQVPHRDWIESIVAALPDLDYYVANREASRTCFLDSGNEFQFSYVEVSNSNEMTLHYCGVNVNAQWGAQFAMGTARNWEFSGLV